MDDVTTGRIIIRARREHGGLLRSLSRFLGLSALASAAARSAPPRTGRNRTATISALLSLATAFAMVLLLIPGSRAPIVEALRAPGQLIQALGGGSATGDTTKGYPRIYSIKLGIDIPIKPGDGGLRPPVEPIAFQYPHTAPIGQPGNTYLYAHDRQGMFLGLHKAQIGDVVIVAIAPTEKLYFQVTEIHANVAWNDLAWLQASSDSRLTLQTCNYSGDYDPRYVVVTKPISATQGRALTGDA